MDGSSPVSSSGSPIDGFVTPRTKVAKMLADIDNAPTPPSPSQRGSPTTLVHEAVAASANGSPRPSANRLLGSSQHVKSSENLGSDLDTDDSGDDVKPRGRIARRMLGVANSSPKRGLSTAGVSSPPAPLINAQDEEDDLYSATPMKPTRLAGRPSISPVLSEVGTGLFVSPAKPTNDDDDSADELPSNPFGSKAKLAELVAQKRAERLAKESEDAKRRKDASSAHASSDLAGDDFEDGQEPADPNIEKIMSDASRPARRASKRALLEMERETQRLSRQQALAHQMKVKKKFTTNDLFAKFNFRKPGAAAEPISQSSTEVDTTASSAPSSDGVEQRGMPPHSTPPSSPPTPLDRQKALVERGALSKLVPVRQDSIASLAEVDEDNELPDIADVLKSSQMPKPTQAPQPEALQPEKKGLKLGRFGKRAVQPKYDSSDDELEIIQAMPAHLRAFDRAMGSTKFGKPAESKAIHHLKHLSLLHSNDTGPLKKGQRPSINPKALEGQLRRQAKEQARKQQLERIEELKAKGIEVQTTEEREKEAEAFESLLEKARQDAVELRKAEKAARKEAGDEGAAQASDDEDEDEDYVGSGSEQEDVDEAGKAENDLIDEAAEESEDEEQEVELDDGAMDLEQSDGEAAADEVAGVATEQDVEDVDIAQTGLVARKARKSRVIQDDDDEESDVEQDLEPATHNRSGYRPHGYGLQPDAGIEAEEPDDDPFAAFGFGAANQSDALMSPAQAFNATMQTPTQATQEDSFDILRRIAPPSASSLPPTAPEIESQTQGETQVDFVAGSQVPESQRVDLNWETQPPETPSHPGLKRDASALIETPGWEPTQDQGLPSPWTVRRGLRREDTLSSIAEHDTQSTVQLRVSESPAPSQAAPRRGRLVRRQMAVADDSDDEAEPAASVRPEKKDAFREMARRRKEALTEAERADANKEMREMMDEAAEESDDEYAGLGGDDFVAPETEEDKEMIDSSEVNVDERALAAHFAERQRLRDEEETSKLYKDLTTGVLRRKMGANAFDLDEDEDELAVRRRQLRQQEEARKRKALLKDENIATLAEGRQSKGKDAFLKAIADDEGDEDLVNLSDNEEDSTVATQNDSQQTQSQQPAVVPLQETDGNKRKAAEDEPMADPRPAAKQRRTQVSAFRRPTSLLEVQESVSFLCDEPNAGISFITTAGAESSSDSEDEQEFNEDDNEVVEAEEARQNDGGFAPNPQTMEARSMMPPPRLPASQRRTPAKPAVVDRLSLKRGSSTSESALGRTAWAAGPTTGGFKVPSLLRRATTSTNPGANDRGVITPNLSREGSSVKMGGTKKSSLAYQARAEERKSIVEASAKRREENTARIAQMRRSSSALGRGLTGRFE